MAQSASGTFSGTGTKEVQIQIGFEPDVILIESGLDVTVTGPVGLYSVAIVKNMLTLNVCHNSTTDTNATRTVYSQILPGGGMGDDLTGAYRSKATYANGVLTVSNTTNSPPEQYRFINGQNYTWTAYKA